MPDTTKAVLNIPIPRELKERLVRYAETEGISQTAAAIMLLNLALTDAGYPRPAQQ